MYQTKRENEIWLVCDELVSRGCCVKEITAVAIGELLLEKGLPAGSYTTRYKFKNSWLQHQQNNINNVNDFDQLKLLAELEKHKLALTLNQQELLELHVKHKNLSQTTARTIAANKNKIKKLEGRARNLEKQLQKEKLEYVASLEEDRQTYRNKLFVAQQELERAKNSSGAASVLAERVDELLADKARLVEANEAYELENRWLKKDKVRLLECLQEEEDKRE